MERRGWIAGVIGALSVLATCSATLVGVACVGGFYALRRSLHPVCTWATSGITVQDLAGRYRTAGGGELVLEASAMFSSHGITIDFDNRTRTLAGPGTWELLSENAGDDISLGFDESRFATYLQISGTRVDPWLYWYIGDPDLCHIERFDRV